VARLADVYVPPRYDKYAGVSFYWVILGSSGHEKQAEDWVTTSYTK
jgi:hypothetical protein